MPRRKAAIKREVLPDPLYGSEQVAKFINVVMRAGKKSIAEKIVYNALTILTDRLKKEHKEEKSDSDSGKGSKKGAAAHDKGHKSHALKHEDVNILDLLNKVLGNVAPDVEVKSRRVGGATYQVPVEVPRDRGLALAMRCVVQSAKNRSEKTMALRLAAEMYDAYHGKGASVKAKEDIIRMAKANQAFAHYRW